MANPHFTKDHEYALVDGDIATIGISDYAQAQLGDVVYVELPVLGRSLKKGEEAAVVESVKAASEIYAPVSGEVIEVNGGLADNPATVNEAAEGAGWFFKLRIADAGELGALISKTDYETYIKDL